VVIGNRVCDRNWCFLGGGFGGGRNVTTPLFSSEGKRDTLVLCEPESAGAGDLFFLSHSVPVYLPSRVREWRE